MRVLMTIAPWVMPWAKKTSKTLNLDALDVEEKLQEILVCYMQSKGRIDEIFAEQGLEASKAYLGQVVVNHLRNLNAEYCTQLSGLNGTTRASDSDDVRQAKKFAMTGGISLNQETGEDGSDTLSEIIPGVIIPVDESIDFEAFIKRAGVLAPLLMGKVDHPKDWCMMFPEAAHLLVENLALREMAVRRASVQLGEFLRKDPEEIMAIVMEFLDVWRGARGDYGDGELDEPSEAEFHACPELARFFETGSVMSAVAGCKPLETITQYRPGYGQFLISVARQEAKSLTQKMSLAKDESEEFVDLCANRAWSYLKAKGGLIKHHAAMERLQQSLF